MCIGIHTLYVSQISVQKFIFILCLKDGTYPDEKECTQLFFFTEKINLEAQYKYICMVRIFVQ